MQTKIYYYVKIILYGYILGTFFATAFNSVPLAMAYLVPFDYILMITSGHFIKLKLVVNKYEIIKMITKQLFL